MGLMKLGARFYWPELGRFIQQDPIGDGMNWYGYVGGNPVVYVDPTGLLTLQDAQDWYMGGMGGASDWVDNHVLGGTTQNFGNTAGLYDSGCASRSQMYAAGAVWGARVAVTAVAAEQIGARAAGAAKAVRVTARAPAGRVVAPQRAITGYTKHGIDSAISHDGVGVSPRAILDAVKNPIKVLEQGGGRLKMIGKDATVVLNSARKVVTTWARNAAGYRIPQ